MVKPTEEKKSEIVEVKPTLVQPFIVDDDIEGLAGAGAENVTAHDQLLPRLTLLQSLSPQVAKKKIEYIEGADVGDWCNVATGDIYKEEILVIPCHFRVSYIQWGKNRSGIVKNFGNDASVLSQCIQNEKRENVLPNGDKIAETAEWFLLVQDGITWKPVFFPLTSTNLKVSRKWMHLSRSEVLRGKNGEFSPPLFYRSWNLKSVEDSNDQGSWFTFKPVPGQTILELDPSKALLNRAKLFYSDVRENKVTGKVEEDDTNNPENARVVGDNSSRM